MANNYFNPVVREVLIKHQIELDEKIIERYREHCQLIDEQNIQAPQKIKNRELELPYSVWHFNEAEGVSHWLVYNVSSLWETKNKDTTIRLLINLDTAEKQVIKGRTTKYAVDPELVHLGCGQELRNLLTFGYQTRLIIRKRKDKPAKYYLTQPYHGFVSLFDLCKLRSEAYETILFVLKEAGVQLKAMHDRGYLYLDMKRENICYSATQKTVTLIDLETSMPQSYARIGTCWCVGTPGYLHEAKAEQIKEKKGLIHYSTADDVYAYYKTILETLSVLLHYGNLPRDWTQMLQFLKQEYERIEKFPLHAFPSLEAIMEPLFKLPLPGATGFLPKKIATWP